MKKETLQAVLNDDEETNVSAVDNRSDNEQTRIETEKKSSSTMPDKGDDNETLRGTKKKSTSTMPDNKGDDDNPTSGGIKERKSSGSTSAHGKDVKSHKTHKKQETLVVSCFTIFLPSSK